MRSNALFPPRTPTRQPCKPVFIFNSVTDVNPVTWALKNEPTLPDRWSRCTFDLTASGQAAKYDSKWRQAVLNFGPLWRGISVGLDTL